MVTNRVWSIQTWGSDLLPPSFHYNTERRIMTVQAFEFSEFMRKLIEEFEDYELYMRYKIIAEAAKGTGLIAKRLREWSMYVNIVEVLEKDYTQLSNMYMSDEHNRLTSMLEACGGYIDIERIHNALDDGDRSFLDLCMVTVCLLGIHSELVWTTYYPKDTWEDAEVRWGYINVSVIAEATVWGWDSSVILERLADRELV